MDDLDKLEKLLDHWIHHNGDHVASYRDWAERMRRVGRNDIGAILDGIAEREGELENLFRAARDGLRQPPSGT